MSISDKKPKNKTCVEFASHENYGLANWCDEKGFYEVFLSTGKSEEAEYYKDCYAWNSEIMWYREIPNWPYYGTRGCDSEIMKDYRME